MDEIKISSVFMRETIAAILQKAIRKRGYEVDLNLDQIYVDYSDDEMHIQLELDVEITGDELWRLVFG
ncbi:MAG: hypothetical protein HFH26_01285 [Clostridiaceae bacterium]|nr:hypothetical protein [Clostridiaceae bacterium]